MELWGAHKQWRDRPADERFRTLKELHAVTLARRQASVESKIALKDVTFQADEDNVVLTGAGAETVPTHWAFSQLCDYLDMPAFHLRRLPPTMVRDELNWAVGKTGRSELVMTWANGQTPGVARSFTTPMYGRLWDHEVVGWLQRATDDEAGGWRRPHAMDEDTQPSGIYGGDRNIFVFLVNDAVRVDDGTKDGLGRGFFCWNSEVKQMSFGFQTFLYRYVCGNHIVWGAKEINTLRMIHLGPGFREKAEGALRGMLDKYLGLSIGPEQAMVNAARRTVVGGKVDDVFEVLTSRRVKFPVKEAQAILQLAEGYGEDPTNLWNLVNAATRYSQIRHQHADARNEMDRRAARLLDMAQL
jgi:hypothetical protein